MLFCLIRQDIDKLDEIWFKSVAINLIKEAIKNPRKNSRVFYKYALATIAS